MQTTVPCMQVKSHMMSRSTHFGTTSCTAPMVPRGEIGNYPMATPTRCNRVVSS